MIHEQKKTVELFTVDLPYVGTKSVLLGLEWLVAWGDKTLDALICVPGKDQITNNTDLTIVLGLPHE